jgi:hypothetical protein
MMSVLSSQGGDHPGLGSRHDPGPTSFHTGLTAVLGPLHEPHQQVVAVGPEHGMTLAFDAQTGLDAGEFGFTVGTLHDVEPMAWHSGQFFTEGHSPAFPLLAIAFGHGACSSGGDSGQDIRPDKQIVSIFETEINYETKSFLTLLKSWFTAICLCMAVFRVIQSSLKPRKDFDVSLATKEFVMARPKKAGRPAKPGGTGRPVRLDVNLVTMARSIADFQGLTVGDYLSDAVRPRVMRDYEAMLKTLREEAK